MLSIKNLSKEVIISICLKASLFESDISIPENLNGKILVNVFFEPSTRTQLSFESAMYRLGGKVINFNKDVSSLKKGESFCDTIKTLKSYGDIFVIRHPDKDKVQEAKLILNKPVINAGDGNGEHPTQAILDFYTIYKRFNIPNDTLNILFVGDIKNSRTIHSLIYILIKFPNFKIFAFPYLNCELIDPIINNVDNIENLGFYDIIYYTRYQKERSNLENEYNIQEKYILNNKKLMTAKKNSIIMHPLPRNQEISTEVDKDTRCVYFEQVENGLIVRMAILDELFN